MVCQMLGRGLNQKLIFFFGFKTILKNFKAFVYKRALVKNNNDIDIVICSL